MHVPFLRPASAPVSWRRLSSGNRSKQFLQGCKVEELPLNTVEKEEP